MATDGADAITLTSPTAGQVTIASTGTPATFSPLTFKNPGMLLTIDAAAGADAITAKMTSVSTPLLLDGGDGSDTITVDGGSYASLATSAETVTDSASVATRTYDTQRAGATVTLRRDTGTGELVIEESGSATSTRYRDPTVALIINGRNNGLSGESFIVQQLTMNAGHKIQP